MASAIVNVTYSKNPVELNEVFTIAIEVVETPDTIILYCGTFAAGQEIMI